MAVLVFAIEQRLLERDPPTVQANDRQRPIRRSNGSHQAHSIAIADFSSVLLVLAVSGPSTLLLRRQMGVADGEAEKQRRAPHPFLRSQFRTAEVSRVRRNYGSTTAAILSASLGRIHLPSHRSFRY